MKKITETILSFAGVAGGAAIALFGSYRIGCQRGVDVIEASIRKLCPEEYEVIDKKFKEFVSSEEN